MIKESEYFSNVFKTEFNKPLVLTEKDRKDFNNSTKCYICKNKESEVKAKYHNHITERSLMIHT